jgi:hypothetical protein
VVNNIAVAGNRAYVADGQNLYMFDVAYSSYHTKVSYLSYRSITEAKAVAVAGDHLYVAQKEQADGRLYVYDISNATKPTLLARRGIIGGIRDVKIVGDYAYVVGARCDDNFTCRHYSEYLTIFDVSNPLRPSKRDSFYYDWSAYSKADALALAVVGDYAYVAQGMGITIFDISQPSEISEIGAWQSDYSAQNLFVVDDYAYVAAEEGGLRILDVSTPTMAVEVGAYEGVTVHDVVVVDQYAYLIGNDYLYMLEISDPMMPVKVAEYQLGGEAHEIVVEDKLAYVAAGYMGVRILDVSDPSALSEVGYYDMPPAAIGVALSDDGIYVTADRGGLFILRISTSIRGRVLDVNGAPFPDVRISSSPQSLGGGKAAISSTDGEYIFHILEPDTYTLTPSLDDYTFLPPFRSLTVPPEDYAQDFIVLSSPLSVTLQANVATSLSYTDSQGLPTGLEFPANTVSLTTTLVLTPTLATNQPAFDWAGHAFELRAYQNNIPLPDFTFNNPVSVTVGYSDADIAVVTNEEELLLWWQIDEDWQDSRQSCEPTSSYKRNTSENTLTIPICHSGRFALFGPTKQLYLPVIYD